METTLQAHWFVLDSCPAVPYRAVRFGSDWNGWATPVITASTLATLLLRVISDPHGSYRAFAINEAGECNLQDHEDRIDILTPTVTVSTTSAGWVGHSGTATTCSHATHPT